MIEVSSTPVTLTIRGHAGYAPPGQDIVCAAVSILVETLARSLPPEDVRLAPGLGEFHFPAGDPKAEFVLTGLRLLAENYPEKVAAPLPRGGSEVFRALPGT